MTQTGVTQTKAIIEKVAEEDVPGMSAETTIESLPVDSLDLFTVIGELEEATGRKMSDEEMGDLETVGDLVRHFFG